MKLTSSIIKSTIDQFKSITANIEIATHTVGVNTVSMTYNVNYKVYTIKNRGVGYYATTRNKAIELFNNQLYLPA